MKELFAEIVRELEVKGGRGKVIFADRFRRKGSLNITG
jgi:acyl-CoA synthetase (NDP forming)